MNLMCETTNSNFIIFDLPRSLIEQTIVVSTFTIEAVLVHSNKLHNKKHILVFIFEISFKLTFTVNILDH